MNILLYIPKVAHHLKILADHKMKNFVIIDFGKYFKSTSEKLYSKLRGEKI